MKLKKIASILLTLCLIIAMMPLAVFADDPAERDGDRWGKDLYILGRKVDTTGNIPDSIPHDGTIHYNAKTKTLMLTNATLDLNDYRMGVPKTIMPRRSAHGTISGSFWSEKTG